MKLEEIRKLTKIVLGRTSVAIDSKVTTHDLARQTKKLLAVAEAAKDVVRFMEPEWRDDVDRGDADTALVDAVAALEAKP